MSRADLFWQKVASAPAEACWEWSAATSPAGYGIFWDGERTVGAHRWSYEHLRAEIPEGLHIDHLCRNRRCVNPWHLEPVTPKVNAERGEWATKPTCPSGHPYDEANTATRSNRVSRECLICRTEQKRVRRYAMRDALLADPSLARHGSVTTYTDWMCRCDACREAATEDSRRRRARSIGRAA